MEGGTNVSEAFKMSYSKEWNTAMKKKLGAKEKWREWQRGWLNTSWLLMMSAYHIHLIGIIWPTVWPVLKGHHAGIPFLSTVPPRVAESHCQISEFNTGFKLLTLERWFSKYLVFEFYIV